METSNHQAEIAEQTIGPEPAFPVPREATEKVAAWAMIENGRYQPRRIKGSCLGRELG